MHLLRDLMVHTAKVLDNGWWLYQPGEMDMFVSIIYLTHWGQNGSHFPDNIFKYIFVNENENVWISLKISLKLFLRFQLTTHIWWFIILMQLRHLRNHWLVHIWPYYTVTCHQQPRPGAPPPDLRRLQRVPRHEKLWNYVTWPAWENWNVFPFNWCLYSSEISDCKSP